MPASDKSAKSTNSSSTQLVTPTGNAKAISGGSAGGSSAAGGSGGGKMNKPRTPYWQGQQAKTTYQDSPHDSDNRSQSSTQSQNSTKKKKHVKWKNKGKIVTKIKNQESKNHYQDTIHLSIHTISTLHFPSLNHASRKKAIKSKA